MKNLLWVSLLFCFYLPHAQAQVNQDVMVLAEEWPPISFIEDDHHKGYAVELVEQLQSRLGEQGKVIFLPWARAQQIGRSKPNTLIVAMAKNNVRLQHHIFLGPIAQGNMILLTRADNDTSFNSLEQVKQLGTIGVYRDGACEHYLRENGFTDLSVASFPKQTLQQLIKSRIRFWCQADLGIHYTFKKLGEDPTQVKSALHIKPLVLYFAFSKSTSSQVVQKWHQALSEYKTTEDYRHLYKKWFNDNPVPMNTQVYQ
ncbi:substrate-binding periplasmic protein [Shewanella maritima]|uniref:substrate-binding periplasmic protein n=1 Tax=Shewanella maritima TaxID=2520507 RepID=UPI003734C29C